jgi:glycosyltransferase involved in cell wall biosynthesis
VGVENCPIPVEFEQKHELRPSKKLAAIDGIAFRQPTKPDSRSDHVAVLLGTFNGEPFLSDQMESIRNQDHANWKVWASDDGSTDSTRELLDNYKSEWGEDRLTICAGPAQGFVSNFLSLVCNPAIDADYFAYCDQDDIWQADKLSRALEQLKAVPANIPALYCSRRLSISESGRELGFSPLYKVPPSFANALVQNIAGGNTMVFNKAAVELLRAAGDSVEVVYHDWWTYLLVTGAGGTVYYDTEATVLYRQHNKNIIGSNTSLLDRFFRMRLLLNGRFRKWNDRNTRALRGVRNYLTPQNQKILDAFISARSRRLLPRLLGIRRSGVHRQTFIGNLGLLTATILRKV